MPSFQYKIPTSDWKPALCETCGVVVRNHRIRFCDDHLSEDLKKQRSKRKAANRTRFAEDRINALLAKLKAGVPMEQAEAAVYG